MSIQNQVALRNLPKLPEEKQEGLSLFGSALSSAGARSVTGLPQTVMMMGLVVAVVGVAMAVFTSNTVAGAGFGVCGVVSLMGLYIVSTAEALERMQQSVDKLNKQELFFQGQTRLIDQAFRSVSKDTERLKKEGDLFDAKLKLLDSTHSRLNKAYSDLELAVKSMGDAGGVYSKNREEIQKRVVEMKAFITQSEIALKEYKETNSVFASHITKFSRAVLGLGQVDQKIERALNAFSVKNGDTPGTREQVECAEQIMGYLSTYLQSQHRSHLDVVRQYDRHFHRMDESMVYMSSFRRQLEETSAQLEPKDEKIRKAAQALEKQGQSVSSLLQQLSGGREVMERERGEVDRQFDSYMVKQDHMLRLIEQAVIKAENKLNDKERSLYQLRESLVEIQESLSASAEAQRKKDVEQQARESELNEHAAQLEVMQRSYDFNKRELEENIELLARQKNEHALHLQRSYEDLTQREIALSNKGLKIEQQHQHLQQLIRKIKKKDLLEESRV
jgi:chromosome segregation ATPase